MAGGWFLLYSTKEMFIYKEIVLISCEMHVDYVKWVIFSWFFYFLNYRCIVYLLFIIVYFNFYEKMSKKSNYL